MVLPQLPSRDTVPLRKTGDTLRVENMYLREEAWKLYLKKLQVYIYEYLR
jgi:hypothetical protein